MGIGIGQNLQVSDELGDEHEKTTTYFDVNYSVLGFDNKYKKNRRTI
jgi:hypothetical protein